jgi:TonB family protein
MTAARSGDTGSRRYPLLVSLVIHAVLVVVMLMMPARLAKKKDKPERIDIVFYSPAEPLEQRFIPLPEPPKERPPQPEPVKIAQVELPEPPVEALPPKPRVESPPPARKTRPPKRKVKTANFGKKQPDPVAQTNVRTARAVVPAGSFGASLSGSPAGTSTTRAVAAGSFGSSDLTVPRAAPPSRASAVISTSFDAGAAGRPTRSGPAGSVKQGGFGSEEAAPAKPRQRKRPTEELDSPVAIVAKPKPIYTDEARRLRIQGEVVLEVSFPTSGNPRVLRVLGSLGHGLDEAAIKAAEKIEFEPARRDGRPVAHTATLRVVFRLA